MNIIFRITCVMVSKGRVVRGEWPVSTLTSDRCIFDVSKKDVGLLVESIIQNGISALFSQYLEK